MHFNPVFSESQSYWSSPPPPRPPSLNGGGAPGARREFPLGETWRFRRARGEDKVPYPNQ